MRFLVDECLSPSLLGALHAAGFEASHVTHLGKRGWSDEALMATILRDDWTFVTGNAFDFRGPPATPGASGGYAGAAIHAGLICLNRPHRESRALQVELLEVALEVVEDLDADLVNTILEVTLTDRDTIEVTLYSLPAET